MNLRLIIIAAVATFVALAIGLGVGLGVGLKNRNNNSAANSQSSSATSSSTASAPTSTPTLNPTLGNEAWRLNTTEEYTLDLESWDFNAPPTTRYYNWTVSEVQGAPDGVLRTMMTINGQFPGPIVRLNQGDRIVANVTNALLQPTTVHWHGMFQNGTNWMDGTSYITQCDIPPGRNFIYNFTVPNQSGTFWYHSHSSTQYADGLFGPLIIHSPSEVQYMQQFNYTNDQVILLQDYYHNLTATYLPAYLASGNENTEPVPDNGLIQGTNYFDCSSLDEDSGYTCNQNSSYATINVQPGQGYRFRLINVGGFATYQWSIDNHTMTIIEADSTMLEPYPVHRLEIAVAQRYSFVIQANQPPSTNYWIRAPMNEYCFVTTNPVLNPNVQAILAYAENQDEPIDSLSVGWDDPLSPVCLDMNATLLVPLNVETPPPADVLYTIQFSFLIGDYALDLAYINGTTWKPASEPTLNTVVTGLRGKNATAFNQTGVAPSYGLSNQYIIDIPTTNVVDVMVQNFDDNSHPFHLHGYAFWVMAMSQDQYFPYQDYPHGFNATNPLRRDTIQIPGYGWALLRFRADNPGLWAFHCHIIWHVEAGLLMQFQVRNDLMQEWVLPDDVLGLCRS